MRKGLPRALLWTWALASASSMAQGTSSISGAVTDAATGQGLPDVYVTVHSPALQADQLAVTDAAGQYRVGNLPPGVYTLRIERTGYRTSAQADVRLEAGTDATVDAGLFPESKEPEPQPRPPPAPSPGVDIVRGARVRPGDRFSSGRSLELLAVPLPGARMEPAGLSLSGASALEHRVLVDGISVTDPANGALLFPLSRELVGADSLEILPAGSLPEHGSATGGALLVETRSGTNEWHGAAYGQWVPGGLEGERTLAMPRLSSIALSRRLWNQGDAGAWLAGPLLRDRLWLSLGVQGAAERIQLTRRLFRMQLRADPGSGLLAYDVDPVTGLERSEEIPGTSRSWFGDSRQLQYAARLTFFPDVDRTLSLSVAGTPSGSGGNGRFGYDPLTGEVQGWEPGAPFALQRATSQDARLVALRGSSAFWSRRVTVDAALGWYHRRLAVSGPDESAGLPQAIFRNGARPGPHALGDFAVLLARGGGVLPAQVAGACADGPGQAAGVRVCPVPAFRGGGPGALGQDLQDRLQARAWATYLGDALGHHEAKVGGEVEHAQLDRLSMYSGGVLLREGDPEAVLDDLRAYGTVDGAGQPTRFSAARTVTRSLSLGAFVQDTWKLLDLLQVHLGLRWDGQGLTAPDGGGALSLWSRLSPRVGLSFDPSRAGRSRLHGSYSRRTQAVPLELVQRAFGGEQHALARRLSGGACDALDPDAWLDPARCGAPANALGVSGYGEVRPPVDPGVQPTTVDELVAGAEYEILPAWRAGVGWVRRTVVRSIRELSADGGATSFIANPGFGLGEGFERAARDHDAVTVSLDRAGGPWMAQLSYTWSSLRGNDPGLFEPPTRLVNGSGPLPGDHTHSVKLFAAHELSLGGRGRLAVGGSYLAESGGPTSALASHPYYGDGAVFLLPRGSGPRLPWAHSVDLHLELRHPLPEGLDLQVSLDAFNLFNFQAVAAVDERYTLSDAVPLACPCTEADLASARAPSGQPVVPNPSFGRPLSYQLPRTVRFGAKVAF